MANLTSRDNAPRLPSAPHQPSRGDDGDAADGPGLWAIINERLSGRWKHAIALGLLLGVVAAVAGFKSATISYKSSGIIHVAPKTTHIMREIPETGMVPLYPSFVQTQATLIASPRVLDRALQTLELEQLPWHDRIEARRGIEQGLEADSDRNSELILVGFTHTSPAVAQTVVNAVIRAYVELFATADGDEMNAKLRTLRNHREHLRNQRYQKLAQIQELVSSSEYAFSDLDEILRHKAMRLQTIESEIRRLQHIVGIASDEGADAGAIDANLIDPITGVQIDYRDLEAFDNELARLGRLRDQARMELARAHERFMPRHRAYMAAEEDLRVVERMYSDRQAVVIQEFLDSDRLPMANWAMEPKQRLEQLQHEAAEERQLVRQMSRAQLTLNELHTEVDEIEQELTDTTARVRGLEMESEAIRRITVASYGELPSRPARDRRHPLAALGAIGGFGMGIGFFFLLSTLDRRIYGVRQLREAISGNRLLGVLPALPARTGDLESSGVAAHCVHQIRNRIEAMRRPGRSAVLAVSSPYQGDGKTSLTLALAASYAASGYRTIIVDCDMIGRSLTSHLMMNGRTGLQECLTTGDPDAFIKVLQVKNLSVLPAGDDPEFGPEKVRKNDLDLLFQRLRRMYDVILVDTGPLFGSVESLPVATAADGVVLTMWRGRRQSRLSDCINSIEAAGACYLGIVLNYAQPSDCNRYLSSSKTSAMVGSPYRGGNGRSNGVNRVDRNVSRNALLRAMQVTSRPRSRKLVGSTPPDQQS